MKSPDVFVFDPAAKNAADSYLNAARQLKDASYYPVLCFTALNLFLWHIEAFDEDGDINKRFAEKFQEAASFLDKMKDSSLCINDFPVKNTAAFGDNFEQDVSTLFSDVWVDMSDDIYFDETFKLTTERLTKNGIDPYEFFNDKTVLDAGCGSGKFSAAIAKFGAKKVIGVDIGVKGLEFAEKQSKKVAYGTNLEFLEASLLNIPLEDNSIDIVWSNGVIHHTLNYEKCVSEFSRILKKDGNLFLYVNGRLGLFELLQDTLRRSMERVPRELMQTYIRSLKINSGRLYWIMDSCFAPYEWKERSAVIELLKKYGFKNIKQLVRGASIDTIEKISSGQPNARICFGEGQLKFIANKNGDDAL